MSEPTTSLSLIAFDADHDALDYFSADALAGDAFTRLSNAETLVGVEMSLPLVRPRGRSEGAPAREPLMRILPAARRIAG